MGNRYKERIMGPPDSIIRTGGLRILPTASERLKKLRYGGRRIIWSSIQGNRKPAMVEHSFYIGLITDR
jgi:hypothetical protein